MNVARGDNTWFNDYPFVDPSDDVRGLIDDAYLAHEDRDVRLPLRIARLTGLGGESSSSSAISLSSSSQSLHTADILILDDADRVVFDSTFADYYRVKDFGDNLRIHEWAINYNAVCRLVQRIGFPDTEDVIEAPYLLEPQNGILDERVSQLLPRRVKSLTVGMKTVRGPVVFRNGYNTEFSQGISTPTVTGRAGNIGVTLPDTLLTGISTTGSRRSTQVSLTAAPGSGLGQFPGCDGSLNPIQTINNVGPDQYGDFKLAAAGCYWVRQPTSLVPGKPLSVPTPATLQLGNDCGPCCECEDYVRVYKSMIRLNDQFKAIGAAAEGSRDTYRTAVGRWTTSKECRDKYPVRVKIEPVVDESNEDPLDYRYLDVKASVCNNTDDCLRDVEIAVFIALHNTDIQCTSDEVVVVPGSVSISGGAATGDEDAEHDLGGEYPEFEAFWDSIDVGDAASVQFRLDFQDCCRPYGTVVGVCAQAAAEGKPLPHGAPPSTVCERAPFPGGGPCSSSSSESMSSVSELPRVLLRPDSDVDYREEKFGVWLPPAGPPFYSRINTGGTGTKFNDWIFTRPVAVTTSTWLISFGLDDPPASLVDVARVRVIPTYQRAGLGDKTRLTFRILHTDGSVIADMPSDMPELSPTPGWSTAVVLYLELTGTHNDKAGWDAAILEVNGENYAIANLEVELEYHS